MSQHYRENIKGEALEKDDCFLKGKQVAEKCCIDRATIYRLMQKFQFPPSFNITEGRVGWLESDVLEWMRLGYQGFYETYGEKLKQLHDEKLVA
jgi:predicted DNA-binding transcriptional regulator AlpA